MRKSGFLAASAIALILGAALTPADAQRSRAAARPAARVDAAFLIGTWGDNGDCSKFITFESSGVFRSYTGGEGHWRLAGQTLSLNGSRLISVGVSRINRNQVRIANANGTVGISQRCPAPVAPATFPVTTAFLIGTWGDNGDCTRFIQFRTDGSFRSYTAGEGRWELDGETLTLSGSRVIPVRIVGLNQNQVRITNADNTVGTSQRCAAAG